MEPAIPYTLREHQASAEASTERGRERGLTPSHSDRTAGPELKPVEEIREFESNLDHS